jgi:hypothetical protein
MNARRKAHLAIMLVVALACVGGGVFLIVERETGTRAKAKVTECVESGRRFSHRTNCTGTWVVGGSLVRGGGHVVVGTIEGAESSDVGKTIDVTVSGDLAYSRSLVLPILLLVLGLLVALVATLSSLALIKAGRRDGGSSEKSAG